MKKTVSILLSVLIALSTVSIFSFSAFAAEKTESEPNDFFSTANKINTGDTIKGKLSSYDDEDYFKIVSSSDGRLDLSFIHTLKKSSHRWYIDIYVAGDMENPIISEEVYEEDDSNYRFPMLGIKKNETYYIYVSTIAGVSTTSDYKISAKFTASPYYEKEVNDVFTQATDITLGKTYSGTSMCEDDKDYYRFKTTDNGKMKLDFIYQNDSKNKDWYIDIYENTDKLIYSKKISSDSLCKFSIPYIGIKKNTTYYIVVENFFTEEIGVEYSLKTSFSKSEFFEKEYNNSYSTASLIKINKNYHGNSIDSDDCDYYKFVPEADGKIALNFRTNMDNNGYKWYIEIIDSKGKKLLDTDADSYSPSKILKAINVYKNKTYYVCISDGYQSLYGVDYSIQAKYYYPAQKTIKAKTTKSSAKLSWSKVKGAKSYEVQMKKGKKYVTVKKLKGNSYKFRNLKKNKSYLFRVRYVKNFNNVTCYSVWKNLKVKTKK